MTVTEEFWYGNLNPQENPASGSEFLRNARRQASGCYEKMKAKLTKEQMEEVENYIETQGSDRHGRRQERVCVRISNRCPSCRRSVHCKFDIKKAPPGK